MRPLQRLRLAVVLGNRVMITFEREWAVRPEPLEYVHCLLEPAQPHRRRIEPNPNPVVFGLNVARAESELETAAAENIGSGEVLSQGS